MIAELLKAATADNHKELESLMFVNEIMNNSLSVDEYKKLLIVNYVIHEKLEDKLISMLDNETANRLEITSRLKLPALEKDLKFWNIDRDALKNLNVDLYLPNNNIAEVLGALYVLEGSTLGGNVIKKHILANPNFKNSTEGLNYYGVYGSELGTKWKNFVLLMNEVVIEADYERCIKCANEMFNNLKNLSKQLNETVKY
ncbi:biliverdin-producing heme oxygenase [Pedobacter mucosus]|uniref:biliverdin-producing heme oxygenase n=1 Tax=Pedobacter mucosus TaxID=2895286 RepID=UPI001EE3E9AA|nr:biliverdin-producing heme oxygenase [Pedobacter mucosus]UKT65479.1 biliverdin-producing heme oxygenase [Pedobacter mucosus]